MYLVLLMLNLVAYFLSFYVVKIHGGIKRNIAFSFTVLIFLIYTCITPSYFYYTGYIGIYGLNIRNYYHVGLWYYFLNITFFLFGYWLLIKKNRFQNNIYKYNSPKPKIHFLFYLVTSVVLLNFAISGINILNIVNVFSVNKSETQLLFTVDETVGFSNYLANFADSIIIILVAAAIFKTNKFTLFVWTIFSFIIFSLLGYRYRIILTLIGFGFVYILNSNLKFLSYIRIISLSLIFMISLLFITVNRGILINKQYSELKFTFDDLSIGETFAEQTRGALADYTLFRYYDLYFPGYDYCSTMILSTIYRALPKFLFSNNEKPVPAMDTKIEHMWDDAMWEPFGEAILNVGFNYVSLGLFGIILFAFAYGLLLAKVQNITNYNSPLDILFLLIFTLLSFQYITRGYMPQTIDHLGFFLIPYWLLKFLFKIKYR